MTAIARLPALLALLALSALAGLAAPAARPPLPNILLIVADDLGWADLGCYGQHRLATPRLDRLAAEGVRFTQFYAGSTVCAPSRNALMTGHHTGHATVRGNAKLGLRPTDVTVAQLLRQAGYATALIGKWGLGAEGTDAAPNAKGFDHFFGYADQTHAHNYYPEFLLRDGERVRLRNVVPAAGPYGQGVATVRLDYSHDLLVDDALAWLGEKRDRPFFLFLSVTLPHANNEAGAAGMEVPDLGRFAAEDWPAPEKGFAAMMARLDRDVGRILDRLEETGAAANTLVLFTSDNGPHREGGHNPEFFDSNGPLRGTKRDLTEGGIRVPFLARWPGHLAAGRVSDHVAYLGDFMATAAELACVPPPPGIDSVSLLPALRGAPAPAAPARDYLYWEFYEGGSAQAVRFGHWKAIRAPMLTGPIQLYDLSADPGETNDIAVAWPERAERAARLMAEAHVPSPDWKVPAAAR